MKEFLKMIPIPMCGLILGLASLGNLLKEYGLLVVGNGFGLVAAVLLGAILAKILLTFEHVLDTLKDPIVASVAPTFTMGVMVLTTYLLQFPVFVGLARLLWFLAIALHYLLMGYFVYRFLIRPSIAFDKLYPSWFIVFVGLGVIAVTSPKYSPMIGQINFWIGLFFYILLLPLILHRVFKIKNMPDPTLPLITIIAAPGSLELTGYLKAFPTPHPVLVVGLLLLSQVLYWFILTRVIRMLVLPFYPSYAAFTFPLAISAFGITTANSYLVSMGYGGPLLELVAKVETGIAALMVVYVLVHYLLFLRKQALTLRGEESYN